VVDLLNQFNDQYGIRFSILSVENDTEFLAMKRAHPDALFVEQVVDTPQQTKSGAAKTPLYYHASRGGDGSGHQAPE
jgi:two-component system sensor histidine kinase EvgS